MMADCTSCRRSSISQWPGIDMPLPSGCVACVYACGASRAAPEAEHPAQEKMPNRLTMIANDASLTHLLLAAQTVSVWTRQWGGIPQPSDECAWRAGLPYTAPSHT